MLAQKLDRLNQLEATMSEINEIKSQLMAELDRINQIESDAIAEVSDLQSEILSKAQVVLPDNDKLANIKLDDCIISFLDRWEKFKRYIDYAGIISYQGVIYVSEKGNLQLASELPGGTNSPIQKAVDSLKGYHQSRYNSNEKMPTGFYNLPDLNPCINPATGKKSRQHWHGNHCRKQVWYSYCANPEYWFYIDWEDTNPEYWISLASEIPVKELIVRMPVLRNYTADTIDEFVSDKTQAIKELNAAKAKAFA